MVTTTGNNVYDMVSASWMALFFLPVSQPRPRADGNKKGQRNADPGEAGRG
ncbi:hypothetical protein KAM338_23820 [Aeromonas caviae]|nr:hypothetical protein KAM330_47570 [Aeromonas hydrophila]BCR31365.1 hypothetical protein KAM376_43710 [Aeromonas caviae]GJB43934.1 hypothetical protein KAM369_44090 [Aeromonas caviae]GJB45795.1 hypothetical protein KAM370_17370 [Aeromonas caviae]GJB66358.1 hypothetical protein KAM375_44120 [Aeromonas caviae]